MSSFLAYGNLRGLLFGFGSFGTNLALHIGEIYRDYGIDSESYIAMAISFDYYLGKHWEKLLQDKGFKREESRDEEIDVEGVKIGSRLAYCPISERVKPNNLIFNISAGVGSFWPLSAHIVREGFDVLYEDEVKKDLENSGYSLGDFSLFIFATSSSGGTGNGSAPEFAPRFVGKLEKEYNLKSPSVFPIGVTVLPFRDDPRAGIAEPNSLTLIGRFSKSVKTLFIGDNDYVRNRDRLGRSEAERRVNDTLAWSLLGLFFMNYVPGGLRYEVADYVYRFSREKRSSFVVPSFAIFRVQDFEKWLKTLGAEWTARIITKQLSSNLAAEIDFDRGASFILLNGLMPSGVSKPSDFEDVLRNKLCEEFKTLRRCEESIHIAIGTIPGIKNIYFTLYLLDPFIPRLIRIYNQNATFFIDERNLESLTRRMLETIPDRTITASLNVAKYVDWLKKSFRDSKEILENYLDLWDMSLSSSYTHTRNFFPRFVPTLNLMSTNLREYIQLEVETIAIEQAQKVNLEELTLMLNEKTPQATKYVFIDYAEKSLNQFLQDINNMLPENIRKEKLFPYLKIADAYLPLEDHLMKYPIKELKAWKNSSMALVYLAGKREEKTTAKTEKAITSSSNKSAQISQTERQKYLEEAERIKSTLATIESRYELVKARALIEGSPELQEEAKKLENQIYQLKQELAKIQSTLASL